MALNKVTYVDGETVITAENLNDIQDAIIELESGASITIDSELSDTSTNPVQNQAITNALNAISDNVSDLQDAVDNIFFATYGETPASEIWNKSGQEKKAVAVIYQGYIYWLVGLDMGVYKECYFSTPVYDDSFLTIHVVGTTWNAPQTVTLAKKSSPTFTGTPKAPTAEAGTNTTQIATTAFVKTAIDNQLSTVYKAAGSVASISALPAPSASYLGYVYDVETAFTTTADFVEGAGIDYPAGTDVAIIAVQSGGTTTYKYDALSGFVDLSGYIEKPANATAGQFLVYDGTDWAATTVPSASGVSF